MDWTNNRGAAMSPARTEPRGRITHALNPLRVRALCGAPAPKGWRLLPLCEVQCARCRLELEQRPLRQARRQAARIEAARLAALDERTLPLFPELPAA